MTGEEINAAKIRMLGLLNELDGCRNAALRGHDSWEEAQDQMDRFINAGSTVLNYYASLPPAVARSILSDDRAREFRDETLNRAKHCNMLATNILYALREKGRLRTRYSTSCAHPTLPATR
ncbi:hypothetical protein [Mesorhizobium huakuii]|uniref:Uncharacterized protein n=1 Tax=Mesorhizobium huakuii TaxID=28104 RepID=A0A7G6T5Y9_9HYPH|nr:hypothetical protein [Mesorhizobium huakuii]QND62171.1 hypothetical protein HB778_39585 [Mesorhizobium huakuii]